MSLLFALTVASVTVKWEAMGPCLGNPANATTDPGFHHVFTHEVKDNQARYIVDNQVLPWRSTHASTFAFWLGGGKDWFYRFTDGKETVLWLNGKEERREMFSMYPISVSPKVILIVNGDRSELEVNGKSVIQSSEISAQLMKQGLLTMHKIKGDQWRIQCGKWSIVSNDRPDPMELKDGRIVVRANERIYVDGKPVGGLPILARDDDFMATPSERGWVLQTVKEPKEFYLNGVMLKTGTLGLLPIEDIEFERGLLMRQDQDSEEEEKPFKLFRVTTKNPPRPFSDLVARHVYEFKEGLNDGAAALIELGEDHNAIIHSAKTSKNEEPKIVWESKQMLSSVTEYGGLALSPDGTRLGFLTETPLGEYVRINDQIFGPYKSVDYLDEIAVVFSPDGKHFAYVAEERNSPDLTLFIDGKSTGVKFDGVVKYGSPKWQSSSQLRLVVGKDTLSPEGKVYRVTVQCKS